MAQHIDSVRRDGELLISAALSAGWDKTVPTTPEWTVRDLVRHQGEVHRWAAAHVAQALQTMSRENYATWPDSDAGLVDWYREGVATLVSTLDAADPDLACWSFLPNGPTGARFWARRQAHETCMHRVDAQSAAGLVTPSTEEHAADGIDEALHGFFARRISRLYTDEPYTFALETPQRRWVVHVSGEGPASTSESGEAGAVAHGSAFDLYLLIWNRRPLDGLRVEGDPAVFDQWRGHARVAWS